MSLESWKTLFEIVGIALIGLTFLDAFGVWYFSGRINERQAEQLREFDKELTGAKTKLEAERQTRLELEKSLTPRVLPYIFNKGVENIASLRPYAGMQAILEYSPDMEAVRAVGSVAFAIKEAGWKVISSSARTDLIDGVAIESHAVLGTTEEEIRDSEKGHHAAMALRGLLISTGWENVNAWLAVPPNEAVPPNTIRIKIGFKPNPYFDPPEAKAIREEMKKKMERLNKPPK